MTTKTTKFNGKETEVVFVPQARSHLEEYAQALYAAGYSKEDIEQLIIGLLWSPLYLGEYREEQEMNQSKDRKDELIHELYRNPANGYKVADSPDLEQLDEILLNFAKRIESMPRGKTYDWAEDKRQIEELIADAYQHGCIDEAKTCMESLTVGCLMAKIILIQKGMEKSA